MLENLKSKAIELVTGEAPKCKSVSELDGVFSKLPGDLGQQCQKLAGDRDAVEALLQRFTGDKSIGKKLDAIYGKRGKKR